MSSSAQRNGRARSLSLKDRPADLDAERNILGAALLHPDAARELAALLPQDFSLPTHVAVFRALMACDAEAATPGPGWLEVVRAELQRRGQLEEVGGIGGLLDLCEQCFSANDLTHYVALLREKTRERRILDLGAQLIEGGDAAKVAEQLREAVDMATPTLQWPMRDWMEVADDPAVRYLVDGVEVESGLLVTGGESGSGKTAVSLDRALRKLHGMKWFGRVTRPSSTLYFAYEAWQSLGPRLRAWRAMHPSERIAEGHYLKIISNGPLLTSSSALQDFTSIITQARRQFGHSPQTIVVDTLNAASPGIDENDAGAMGQILRVLADLRCKHEVAVELLHHTTKPQAGKPTRGIHALRGSSALAAGADTVLVCSKDRDERCIEIAKSRDAEIGKPWRFEIRGIETGKAMDDGRPEYGGVAMPAAPPVPEQQTPDAEVARLAAAAAARRKAVVETVRRMGGYARSKTAIVELTPGNDGMLYTAIEAAVAGGDLLPDGKGYRLLPDPGSSLPESTAPLKGGAVPAVGSESTAKVLPAVFGSGRQCGSKSRKDLQ